MAYKYMSKQDMIDELVRLDKLRTRMVGSHRPPAEIDVVSAQHERLRTKLIKVEREAMRQWEDNHPGLKKQYRVTMPTGALGSTGRSAR